MTRITNLMQSQMQLANLNRNQFDLNDLSNQLSSQVKTQKFSGIASQANQYLNTSAIQSRSENYLDTITRTNTRLSLMDQNLTAIQKIASDFQTSLSQQSNSTTPPNVAQLAKTALASLSSYLNATDGSESLFSGSRLAKTAVTNLAANPTFPSTVATLTGNLPTVGTQNTQVNPPTPGSFLDAAVDQSEAVIDTKGIANKVSLRFIKVAEDDPSTTADELRYDAYITGITRVDTGASAVSPAITVDSPIKLNQRPFNPRDLANTLVSQPSLASQNSIASTPSVASLPSTGTGPSVASIASTPSYASVPAQAALTAGLLVLQTGRSQPSLASVAAVGTAPSLPSAPSVAAVPALANGGSLYVEVASNGFSRNPATAGTYNASASTMSQANGNNASPTAQIRLNGSLAAIQPVGATVDTVLDGPYAIYDSNGNGHRVVIRYTKTQTDVPSQPGTPADPTATPPVAAQPYVPGQTRNIWKASIISMTDLTTGKDSTIPAASVTAPIQILNSSGTADINVTTTLPTELGIINFAAGTLATNGGVADPTATMNVKIMAGDLNTTAVGSNITLAYDVPSATPAVGTAQLVRLGLNFNAGAPVNTSVGNPTPGSYADITYNNAEALVDSGGNRHDVKIRIVRNPTQGVPVGNTLPFNVYIISMKQSANGSDSTDPAITEQAPQLIGSFDPANSATSQLVDPATGKLASATVLGQTGLMGIIQPKLKTGYSINVRLPFIDTASTGSTFTNSLGSTTLSRPENTTPPPYKTTPTDALLVTGTLSSSATPVLFTGTTPSASTINANNTVTVRYTGASALIDSKGVAYNATVQYQYQLNSKTGGRPAWVATVTDISDPATNKTIAGFTATDIPQNANTTNVGFNPSDTLRGPLNLGPVSFSTPNGTLKFTLPVNSATFSTSGATALVPGGEAPTALSANITDTSYFQTPNPPSADTTNSQLTARVSDDLTLNYGIRADNLAFENLVRVLNFMQSQSTPPSQSDLQAAQTLIGNSISGVQTLRSQVAGNQITLNDEKTYHQTVVNMATDTRSNILSADTTEVGVKITDLKTILEASYSTLSTIRSLSLVNFLK